MMVVGAVAEPVTAATSVICAPAVSMHTTPPIGVPKVAIPIEVIPVNVTVRSIYD